MNHTLSITVPTSLSKRMMQLYIVYRRCTLNNTDQLKISGWKKIYHANKKLKSAEIIIPDKRDFKTEYEQR